MDWGQTLIKILLFRMLSSFLENCIVSRQTNEWDTDEVSSYYEEQQLWSSWSLAMSDHVAIRYIGWLRKLYIWWRLSLELILNQRCLSLAFVPTRKYSRPKWFKYFFYLVSSINLFHFISFIPLSRFYNQRNHFQISKQLSIQFEEKHLHHVASLEFAQILHELKN